MPHIDFIGEADYYNRLGSSKVRKTILDSNLKINDCSAVLNNDKGFISCSSVNFPGIIQADFGSIGFKTRADAEETVTYNHTGDPNDIYYSYDTTTTFKLFGGPSLIGSVASENFAPCQWKIRRTITLPNMMLSSEKCLTFCDKDVLGSTYSPPHTIGPFFDGGEHEVITNFVLTFSGIKFRASITSFGAASADGFTILREPDSLANGDYIPYIQLSPSVVYNTIYYDWWRNTGGAVNEYRYPKYGSGTSLTDKLARRVYTSNRAEQVLYFQDPNDGIDSILKWQQLLKTGGVVNLYRNGDPNSSTVAGGFISNIPNPIKLRF